MRRSDFINTQPQMDAGQESLLLNRFNGSGSVRGPLSHLTEVRC